MCFFCKQTWHDQDNSKLDDVLDHLLEVEDGIDAKICSLAERIGIADSPDNERQSDVWRGTEFEV